MNTPVSPIRAVGLLSVDLTRRLLREGIVMRSLVFPAVLSAGAIVATVVAWVLLRPPGTLAVASDLDNPGLIEAAKADGWPVIIVDDPKSKVEGGEALVGTDGETIWTWRYGSQAVRIDGLIRQHTDAGWFVKVNSGEVARQRSYLGSRNLVQFMGALFAFYGVIFGAGSVARDRDQGTFDAELAMAVPRWVHGAARWIAGTAVLSAFFLFSVALFEALIGTPDPLALTVHGVSACAGSTAIGMIVIGRGSLDGGFIGPMSAGLVAVVSLLSWGLGADGIDTIVPVASMLSNTDPGWASLGMSALWGAFAVTVFTWRSTFE